MKIKIRKSDLNVLKTQQVYSESHLAMIGLFFVLLLFLGGACKQDAANQKSITTTEPWKLICIGDGHTVGVGVNPDLAFPALLQATFLSNGFSQMKVVNAGIKNETIEGIDQRINWILQQRFDAILLSLNAAEFTEHKRTFWQNCFKKIRTTNPEALILAGAISENYTKEQLETYFKEMKADFDVEWIDLQLLQEGQPTEYWEKEGANLTEKGHEVLAKRLFEYLN